jgi:hypothetical protein
MHVRQAVLKDKEKWDSFVDSENGSFFHYFDWKSIYEARGRVYIPLLVENEFSEIIGILPIVKQKSYLSASLVSLPEGAFGGFVVKKDLTNSEKNNAISLLIQYIDKNFSRGCSTFTLNENLLETAKNGLQPTEILIKNGFTYNFNKITQLPCTYILELKQPFENYIWNEQWGHRLKNKINKSKKMGIVVKEDKNLRYSDDFFNMLLCTNKRLDSNLLSKDEVVERLKKFNEKTKLFVAFLEEEPLAAVLCYYQSSICYLSKLPSYEKAREYDANTLLTGEAIRNACENGYRYCEFGVTDLPAQTRWKEQFNGVKIPLRIYEKKYSNIRTILEKEISMIKWAWTHKQYIWNNRNRLMTKVLKREKKI